MTTKKQLWRDRIKDRIRFFNRRILNPLTLTFAGRRHSPYAIVGHLGRRSRRTYTTPVVAAAVGDHFVIPLPYGDQVDWCRNVLAAGGCALAWNGDIYLAGEPEVIDAATGMQAFSPVMQSLLGRAWGGTEHFLRVKRLSGPAGSEATPQSTAATQTCKPATQSVAARVMLAIAALWFIRRLTRRGCRSR